MFAASLANWRRCSGSWRNWQTRKVEGLVPARACWFNSSRAHFWNALQPFGHAGGFFYSIILPLDEMNRREFLSVSASAGALLLPESLRADQPPKASRKASHDEPQIRVLMAEADGSPLAKERAETLCARDMANDPLPQRITRAEGRARIVLPKESIQISLRLKVPGFGEVYCWADNEGKGYS